MQSRVTKQTVRMWKARLVRYADNGLRSHSLALLYNSLVQPLEVRHGGGMALIPWRWTGYHVQGFRPRVTRWQPLVSSP